MHPAVLDATGYILLSSSFIALAILLRKGCGHKWKSPFYILSTSDVVSTILTAIVLLANRTETGMRLNFNTNGVSNRTWTIENGSAYRLSFSQIYNLRAATGETDLDVNLTCDMKDILMQYGMLLAAFANAFVSLLTFTAQCNFNATCVKRRCADIIESSANNARSARKSAEVAHRERDKEQATSQQGDHVNVTNRSGIVRRIARISKFRTLRDDDKKPASFLVTSHWLVPFLVVGILYFAGYNDMSIGRRTEDTQCVFESNFPLSDFRAPSDVEENLEIVSSIMHTTPLKDNYFLNEEYLNVSQPSSVEIDEVVSKIQNIVRIALNDNSTYGTISPGSSETEKYTLTNNIMSYMKDNTDVNSIIQRLNGTLTKQNVDVRDSSSDKNNDLHQDLKMFNDTSEEELDVTTYEYPSDVSQVSIENKSDAYQEDMRVNFATEKSTTRRTTRIPIVRDDGTTVSNTIYDDIIKRIQSAVKNHNRTVNRHEVRPERRNFNYIARRPNSIGDLSPGKDNNLNHYVDAQSDSLRVTNECLVSMEFLKFHLFVSFVAIYFLPILFSCVLHTRGKHVCKSALALLKAQADLVPPKSRNGVDESENNSASLVRESNLEFRFPAKDDKISGCWHSIEESNESQGSRNETDKRVTNMEYHSCGEARNESILSEANCTVRILDTVKLSLILCVVLWTPAFLGILLRVLSCIRSPQWLTDVTFFSAISFGVVRNILDINIIKIQEVCGDAGARENRIHPIK